MTLPLHPILRPDAQSNRDLLFHGHRDFIGVESVEERLQGIRRGINRAAQWTCDFAEWAAVEHDLHGVHQTPRIPRAFIRITHQYEGSGVHSFAVDPGSYVRGKVQRDHPELIQIIAQDGFSRITVKLAEPMPSASYGYIDCTEAELSSAIDESGYMHAWCWVEPIDEWTFYLYRQMSRSRYGAHYGPTQVLLVG